MSAVDGTLPDESATADEHLNLRRLPPVEPVKVPDRYSQTLLRQANTCLRAGYLYQRHHGGMPAHELDRGTAFHIAQAKVTNLILERHAIDATPEGDVDYGVDEFTAKLMLDEVFDEHPELTVPLHERDELRMMMAHMSEGWKVNPATVVAVERKFVLQLGDHRISGVLDLGCIEGRVGKVHDYKTRWDLTPQTEYAHTFQGRLYAVLFVYGHPVVERPCTVCGEWGHENGGEGPGKCEACGGKGYVEERDAPLGAHLDVVEAGEVFPRFLQDDGTVPERTLPLARIEIDALRHDLEDQCNQLAHAFETWEFPAVPGSHCKECPCEPECPLPPHLRRYAGAIQTEDQAREAAEWWTLWDPRLKATKDELKGWCKINGPLRFGRDMVLEFAEVVRRETDHESLEEAVKRTAAYGEPFDLNDHRRERMGTQFKPRRLSGVELDAERQEEP